MIYERVEIEGKPWIILDLHDEEDKPDPRAIPCRWEICLRCSGAGQVKRSINMLTCEEALDADVDLADPDRYPGGVVSVPCPDCRGKRVMPELLDPMQYSKEEWEAVKVYQDLRKEEKWQAWLKHVEEET